jgi:hypothetical protein
MTIPVRLPQVMMLVATLLSSDRVFAQRAEASAPSPTNAHPVDAVQASTNNTTPAAEIGPNGNPLWSVPLATLSVTRERPIFSPMRRPPAVASVAANPAVRIPERTREPERPQLALVGTIIGDKDALGVFVDDATKSVVRLRRGDDYHGWILQNIHGREATLQKDEQTTTLSLPRPSEEFAKSISPRSR